MNTYRNIFKLDGQSALVVGGAGIIGREICKGLAANGARLIIADLARSGVEDFSAELSSLYGERCVPVTCDCATEDGLKELMGRADEMDNYNIVVHCIGLISSVPIPGYAVAFEEQTLHAWDLALKTNLTSAFLLSKYVNNRLDRVNGASLIFISSIYGSLGPDWSLYKNTTMGNPLAYGASKGGLQQLMRYLATLWAPSVRVNCVSPGGIQRGQNEKFISNYRRHTPMGRMACPEDIVGPVIFLASGASRYITGQNILVDGGWSAW